MEYTPVFSVAPDVGVVPNQLVPDSDDALRSILRPVIGPKQGSCVRPAEYASAAASCGQTGIVRMHGALFDVDEPEAITRLRQMTDGTPVGMLGALWDLLGRRRMIAWTTYGSTRADPRFALLVPFAAPVEPAEFVWVHEQLRAQLQGLASAGQFNLDRLRFLPRVPTSEALAQHVQAIWGDTRLDPRAFGPPPEGPAFQSRTYRAQTGTEAPRDEWLDDEQALLKARRYFANVGHDVVTGTRHNQLLRVACVLLWDFALPREDALRVLLEVNARFPEPHREGVVGEKLDMAQRRVSEVMQVDRDGREKLKGSKRLRPPGLTVEELADYGAVERKSTSADRREVGRYIKAMCPTKGGIVEPIAVPRRLHGAIAVVVEWMGRKFPAHDHVKLADLFAPTLQAFEAQSGEPAPSIEQIAEQIAAAQSRFRAAEEERRSLDEEMKRQAIYTASRGRRDTQYSDAEMEAFAHQAGVTRAAFLHQLVVSVGSTYYVFMDGQYEGPFNADQLDYRLISMLSLVPGIELETRTKQGDLRPLMRREILERHCVIAHNVFMDMAETASRYVPESASLREAATTLRELDSEYSPVVDEWLSSFDNAVNLKRWLAWLPDNATEALPALYVYGAPGTGKTLLAMGLSRLWIRPPDRTAIRVDKYYDAFNGLVLKSPLLVADEYLPSALTRKGGDKRFRDLVFGQTHDVRRKYMHPLTVRGYMRLMIMANDTDILPYGHKVNDWSTAATAERFVLARADYATRDIIERLPKHERDKLIDDDIIAKHVMWLRDNREPHCGGRFPFDNEVGDDPVRKRLRDKLAYEAPDRDAVLSFTADALLGETQLNLQDAFPVFIESSRQGDWREDLYLGVNVNALHSKAQTLLGNSWRLGPTTTRRALASLSAGTHRARHRDKNVNWHLVRASHLCAYVELNELGSADDVIEVMAAILEEHGPKFVSRRGYEVEPH